MNKKGMFKKIVVVLIAAIYISSLTGCGESKKQAPVATKKGELAQYTFEEINTDKAEGIFVMNNKDSFTPLISGIPGFQGITSEANPKRFLWFTDNEMKVSNLIPTVTPDKPLVAIYNSNSEMPKEWYVEKYEDKGYTVGCHFFLREDKSMFISMKNTLGSTTAAKQIDELKAIDTEYAVVTVNGDSQLPINNIDPNMEMLLGLQQGKVYAFEFYKGTKATPLSLYADTRAFQSESFTPITTPLNKTEKGYFIINMPIGLKDGYYYLNNLGFFKYESE